MHNHSSPEQTQSPLWKRILGSVPIIGSFVNPANKNVPQVIDGALYDASAITGQVAFTLLCPVKLTANFPKVSDDDMRQMEVEMLAEMSARMWLGDLAGKAGYRIIVHPIKIAVDNVKQVFNESETAFAVKIAQMIPLLGPFLGAENWKQALRNGVSGNIHQLSMVVGGAYFMMLSPYGMGTDPVSISVGTTLMIGGMAVTMVSETLIAEAAKKSYQALAKCNLWSCNDKKTPLIGLQKIEAEEQKLLSDDSLQLEVRP